MAPQSIDESKLQALFSFATSQFGKKISTTKQLQSAISSLVTEANTKPTRPEEQVDTKIADYEMKIRELQLTNDELSRRNTMLEEEKTELTMKSELPHDVDYQSSEEAFSLFEEVLHSQAEEINQLCFQRQKLIQNVNHLDQVLNRTEDELRKSQQTANDNLALANKFKGDLSRAKQVLPSICEEIDSLLPDDFPQISLDDPRAYLHQVVQLLIEQPPTQVIEQQHHDGRLNAVASQLDGAVRFIQKLANSSPNECDMSPIGLDPTVRTITLTQCAHINKFIDEHLRDLDLDQPNVFDNDYSEQIRAFLSVSTGSDLSESPVRELFAMYTSVVEVNKLMMNYIEEMKIALPSQQDETVIEKLKDDNDRLIATLEERNEELHDIHEILNGENVEDLIHLVDLYHDAVEQNDELLKQNQDLKVKENDLEALKSEHTQLQMTVKERDELHNEESRLFTTTVDDIEEKQKQMEANFQAKVSNLEAELENKKRIIKKATKEQTEAAFFIDKIQERADQLIKENQELAERRQMLENALKNQEIELNAVKESAKKLNEIKSHLKERLSQSENVNSQSLADIKRRNEDLRDKYDARIAQLEEEAAAAHRTMNEATLAKSIVLKEKSELVQQIAKLRVSERSLKLKISAMEERSKLDKSQKEAREQSYMISVNSAADFKITEMKGKIGQAENLISKILEEFWAVEPKQPAAIEELCRVLELKIKQIDFSVYEDAKNLRKALKLPKDITLSVAIRDLSKKHEDLKKDLAESQQKAEEAKENMMELRRSYRRSQIDQQELSEWDQWGRSLYRQIAVGKAMANKAEIRFMLEEAILASIGHRQMLRKMEILRVEKSILENGRVMNVTRKAGRPSLRQLVVGFMFMRRLEMMSGHLKPSIPISASPTAKTSKAPMSVTSSSYM